MGAIGMQVIRDITVPCPCCGSASGGQAWPIRSCAHYLQHEGNLSKVPLHLIVATTLMDLLHVDLTSREMTLELNRPLKLPMSGVPGPFHEACNGICDPQSDS